MPGISILQLKLNHSVRLHYDNYCSGIIVKLDGITIQELHELVPQSQVKQL